MEDKDLRSGVLELWRDSDRISKIKATGISMEPLIKEGDEVIIKHSGVPEFGDIILYNGSDGLVVHRIIGKRIDKGKTYFLEKGDSSPVSNSIPKEKVLGIAIGVNKDSRIIYFDSRLSKLIGKAMALYSLLSLKILSIYNFKNKPRYLSALFSFPRRFLTWVLRVSKG